jgi:intergrase/recombinase
MQYVRSGWHTCTDRENEGLILLSYAVAVQRLLGRSQPDNRAIEAYREIVGTSRDVASRHIMEKLLLSLMTKYQVSKPW